MPACVPRAARGGTLEEIFALDDLRYWLPSERLVAGSDSGNFVFDQRTVTKALRDIGPLDFLADGEPFAGCLFHEMVIRDGRKMSKHLGNVVDPDELVERYGADTVRLAVLYAARPQRSLNWSDSAGEAPRDKTEHFRRKLLEEWCPAALERVTADMDALEMHSAVRNVMRLFDRIKDFEKRVRGREPELGPANRAALLEALALHAALLGPLAPHLAQELLEMLGDVDDAARTPWPGVSLRVPA